MDKVAVWGTARVAVPLVGSLLVGAGILLAIALRSSASPAPANRHDGIPGCESAAVAFEMRDTYGKQLTALYSLVPTNYLKAAFFELRRAKQESAGPGWRLCKGSYNSLLGSGTLTYKVTWYDATNTDDGRIEVLVSDASSPKTIELLSRVLASSPQRR